MAPIKFEENIREKLQERELSPSKDAWKKLEAKLEAEAPQKSNRSFWFAVAAAVAALLILGALVYNPFQQTPNGSLVEEAPVKVKKEENTKEIVPQEITSSEIASESLSSEEKTEGGSQVAQEKSLPKKKEALLKQNETPSEALAQLEKKKTDDVLTASEAIAIKEKSFEDSKAEEVINELKKLKESNIEITIEEVDALLAKAQREIQTQRILTESTQKVDAAALLLDVELELERSFRDKVFDALGDGFEKIRTAVTERNN
ncbi:MAG: hypothetical protein OQJ83_06940 [Altibacter sp.]|nr:hypothetical protein [Altibacter sp.]